MFRAGLAFTLPKKITIESPEKVEILSPNEYFEYKNASLSVKLNDASFNLSSIGIVPVAVSIGGFKLENKNISLKREGGVLKWVIAGTETKVQSLKNTVSILTTFF